jgi:hypothetical protein
MSTTLPSEYSAVATCTIPEGTPTAESVAMAVYDFIVNHPEIKIPEYTEEFNSDEFYEELLPYLQVEDNLLVISYDGSSPENGNWRDQMFNFLVNHFVTLQTSDYMMVVWQTGDNYGTDYYGKDGKIDIEEAIKFYLKHKNN